MHLERFFYYVSVKGRRGGVASVDFVISPGAKDALQDDVNSAKAVLKRDFQEIETLLDEFLAKCGAISLKKIPVLTDSPHSLTAGFDYSGGYRGAYLAKSLLPTLFPMLSGRRSWLKPSLTDFVGSVSANLIYSIQKMGSDAGNAQIILKIALGHSLNISALDNVLDLPNLTVSAEAEKEIGNVRQITARDAAPDPRALLDHS